MTFFRFLALETPRLDRSPSIKPCLVFTNPMPDRDFAACYAPIGRSSSGWRPPASKPDLDLSDTHTNLSNDEVTNSDLRDEAVYMPEDLHQMSQAGSADPFAVLANYWARSLLRAVRLTRRGFVDDHAQKVKAS